MTAAMTAHFKPEAILLCVLLLGLCSCAPASKRARSIEKLKPHGELDCDSQSPENPVLRIDLGLMPPINSNRVPTESRLTDEDLKELVHFPELEWLSLYNVRNVTDTGVLNLGPMPNLKYLCLRHTNITDVGLERLESFSSLEFLEVGYTNVTQDGVDRFVARRPKCKVLAEHLSK